MKQHAATIIALHDDTATVRLNGAEFSLPRTLVPTAAQTGDTFVIAVGTTETMGSSVDAKSILNELLSS